MKEGNHKYGVAGRTWSLAGKARFQVRGSALHSLSDSLGTLRPQRLAASLSDPSLLLSFHVFMPFEMPSPASTSRFRVGYRCVVR